jgi:hypothetical protein
MVTENELKALWNKFRTLDDAMMQSRGNGLMNGEAQNQLQAERDAAHKRFLMARRGQQEHEHPHD